MRATFFRGVAYGLTLLQVFVSANPIPLNEIPEYFQTEPITRRDLTANQVMADLGAQLSFNTTIDGPSSSSWANLTERWSTHEEPDIEVVVSVGAEADIAKVVRSQLSSETSAIRGGPGDKLMRKMQVQYCNKNGIEFMAVNRGHALCVYTMKKFKGVQIDVKQLTGITIQPGETSAVLQAGTYGIEIMQTLWDQGFVTRESSPLIFHNTDILNVSIVSLTELFIQLREPWNASAFWAPPSAEAMVVSRGNTA